MIYKTLSIFFIVTIFTLQVQLWVSPNGLQSLRHMESLMAERQGENSALKIRNNLLAAEIKDLKTGLTAVEERARRELGMVAVNETFYMIPE